MHKFALILVMLYPRSLQKTIQDKLERSNKIILLYGPRQVGKTTLVQQIVGMLPLRTLVANGDELRYADALSSRDSRVLEGLVKGYELLVIDEAQRIPDIGLNLKILHDSMPSLRIIATGSSSFELANRVSEPLTGRTWTHVLFPIAICELAQIYNPFELRDLLDEGLVFGSYPEIQTMSGDTERTELLREICGSYLYKDILELTGIRNRDKIADLLRLLAYQIGSQVSLEEIGRSLGMGKDTVNSYIDLLEKSFVVFRLAGFSRNLRKEIVKTKKIYFYDLGIRNTLIDNLKRLPYRNDVGQLWENFLIIERLKTLSYQGGTKNRYFWRTYTGAEIDYVEESGGQLQGYEFTHGNKRKKPPATWNETYPEATWKLVNSDNYLDFLTNFDREREY